VTETGVAVLGRRKEWLLERQGAPQKYRTLDDARDQVPGIP
jgi:hypothetical protein